MKRILGLLLLAAAPLLTISISEVTAAAPAPQAVNHASSHDRHHRRHSKIKHHHHRVAKHHAQHQ